jgi:hypothetical protein
MQFEPTNGRGRDPEHPREPDGGDARREALQRLRAMGGAGLEPATSCL